MSCPSVERSLLRGKRDREFGSVCCFLNTDRKNLGEYFDKQSELFKVNAQLKKLSEAEVKMDRKEGEGETLILLKVKPANNLNHRD